MRVVTAGVRLAVLALPPVLRRRYREEWSADLAGVHELGLSPYAVLAGAFGTVLSIDRTDPMITGLPRSELRQRRGRWATALLTAAVLLAAGSTLHGYVTGSALGVIMTVIITIGVLAGCWMVIGVFRIRSGSPVVPTAVRSAVPAPTPIRWAYGAGFALAILVVVAVGLLDVTVWGPLAMVPGSTLDEIYAAMAAAEEGTGVHLLIGWGILAVAAAVGFLVFCGVARPARTLTRQQLLAPGLLLTAGMIMVGWFAGFPIGMGLGDTFDTADGNVALSGSVLALAGLLALTGGTFAALAPPVRPPHRAG